MPEARAAQFSGPGPDAVHRDALKQGVFQIQRCSKCSSHFFYPRALCPKCGSPDYAWVKPSGRGTVYSTSVVRQRPEDGPDYNVALVDLAEGPRLMSRIVDLPPAEVKIGMAVEAEIGELNGKLTVLFRSAGRG